MLSQRLVGRNDPVGEAGPECLHSGFGKFADAADEDGIGDDGEASEADDGFGFEAGGGKIDVRG